MIDMKLSPDQSPAAMMGLANPEENDAPQYPEGLKITLEGEALKRLGVGSGTLPQVGTKARMHAIVEVVEVCKEETQTKAGYCVELQITAMELLPEAEENEQQAAYAKVSQIYG